MRAINASGKVRSRPTRRPTLFIFFQTYLENLPLIISDKGDNLNAVRAFVNLALRKDILMRACRGAFLFSFVLQSLSSRSMNVGISEEKIGDSSERPCGDHLGDRNGRVRLFGREDR
jgi:hypothetical protein